MRNSAESADHSGEASAEKDDDGADKAEEDEDGREAVRASSAAAAALANTHETERDAAPVDDDEAAVTASW